MIFGINTCLPHPYREMEVITGLEFPPSLQARQSDRPNRTPPGAHPGKAKGSEAVRCARNRLCLIMAADSSVIIAHRKQPVGQSPSFQSDRACILLIWRGCADGGLVRVSVILPVVGAEV